MSDSEQPDKQAIDASTQQDEDFYMDGPYCVFTEAFHLKRGFCCNSGCRHCPYKDESRPDN